MKKLLFVLLFTLPILGFSQKFEGGIMGGASYYIGDLNLFGHFKPLKFGGGLILRKNVNSRISLRGTASFFQVEAYDSESSSESQQNRNLHFRSKIWEVAAGIEINFINYKMGDIQKHPFSPYLFFELAYFHMNPEAQLNDEWYELQTLGTEGQGSSLSSRNKYGLGQLAIPFGVGFRMNLTKMMALSLEYGVRKTFTDYLDDVSGTYVDPVLLAEENGALAPAFADRSLNQETMTGMDRGDSGNKDWYFFTGAALTFIIGKDSPCPTW